MRQILTRHLASGIGTSALIAVLIAVTVFVVALAPRALVRLGTEELRYELSQQPPVRIDLRGTGTIGFGTSTSPSDIHRRAVADSNSTPISSSRA